MEFLDYKKKRDRTIRLFVGYFLVAILIGLATLIVVYLAQGYGYSPESGVVQSGLVFIDTQPVSGKVYIDGQLKGNSNMKVELVSGKHSISISQSNYRTWSKKFNLLGGSVLYISYPLLIPNNITVGITQVLDSPPVWVSQSPNDRWIVSQPSATSPVLSIFDTTNINTAPVSITLPEDQLISYQGQFGAIKPIEWSSDNRHLLVEQTLPDGNKSYLIIDTQDASQSVNISTKLGLGIASSQYITLFNKNYNQYYVLDTTTGTLSTADLTNGLNATPVLTDVVAYKSFADNLILYVTYSGAKADQAQAMVLSNQTDKYLLQSLPRDTTNQYLLDLAQYSGDWYYVTSDSAANKVLIYKNPLSRTSAGNTKPIIAQMSLALSSPQFVSFSNNTQFVSMQSGQQFVVYDAQQNQVYRYTSSLPIALTQQAKWMDGDRMTVVTNSKVQEFDFDGTNLQTLTASRPEFTAYFDSKYKYIFTLMPQSDGKIGFETGQLVVSK